MSRLTKKICRILLFSNIVALLCVASSNADNTSYLIQRFQEQTREAQREIKRVCSYQKTYEKVINNTIIQNQRNIAEQTRKVQDQSRIQRVKLDELRRKMDNLKRQQSSYSRIKKFNSLNAHFYNMRNNYK